MSQLLLHSKRFLRKVIRKLEYVVVYVVTEFFSLIFSYKINQSSKNIVIFDVDNTIANTWEEILKRSSYLDAWKNTRFFDNFNPFFKYYEDNDFDIFYLTARPLKTHFLTKKWLKENKLPNINIFTTVYAHRKLSYLRKLKKEVIYYDDLSYGTEYGKTKYYIELIQNISKLKYIKYINYETIKSIQCGEILIDDFLKTNIFTS